MHNASFVVRRVPATTVIDICVVDWLGMSAVRAFEYQIVSRHVHAHCTDGFLVQRVQHTVQLTVRHVDCGSKHHFTRRTPLQAQRSAVAVHRVPSLLTTCSRQDAVPV